MSVQRLIPWKRCEPRMQNEARCDACGKLIASVTFELIARMKAAGQPVFFFGVRHECESETP